ncbi:MAG: hypothetical protein H6708_31405 [Kofleriaceae bacterium]|nr:hypothetical protein [Myxococcales bacterium]MCB9564915.1 hypothetical protein [Kofleriaceae bacterium]
MTAPLARNRQRGNAMVLMLLALSGLAALGGLTALSVRGGLDAAGHDRFKAVALYAAESGAAAAIDFVRQQAVQGTQLSDLVEPDNVDPQRPAGIVGNEIGPGDVGNPLSPDMQAWYEVEILNNPTDTGLAAGDDTDGRIVIRSTGHGPDGAVAQVEWEVRSNFSGGTASHCPGYGQRGLAEDGAGRNDCLTTIDATDTATYTPGGN